MAEAFAKRHGINAVSAGTQPSTAIDPMVVKAMKEKGIAFSDARPKALTSTMIEDADLVVTMGCSVEKVCPAPMIAKMQKKLLDWDLEDPKGKSVQVVRQIRDEIERKVTELLGNNP